MGSPSTQTLPRKRGSRPQARAGLRREDAHPGEGPVRSERVLEESALLELLGERRTTSGLCARQLIASRVSERAVG